MPNFDLILRGGRVLTSSSDGIQDIGVKDGRIAAIGQLDGSPDDVDCTGKCITPGGVDVHAHIEQMSGMGLMNADTFETATRSAAIGGTTSVVSFSAQEKGQRLSEAMVDYAARAERGAAIDHAFHIIVSDLNAPHAVKDLRDLIRAGHRSIKVFTTYNIKLDDRAICEVLSIAKEENALVCVHAENDGLIGWTKDKLLAGGKTHPKHHALSHPRLAEIEAVGRLIAFAEYFATPVMLFHISTTEAVDAIRTARARGVPVWAETCPHYLFMDETVLNRPGTEGAKWMCSPPQRTVADQDALWTGLADGTLSVVSSDHAPYRYNESGKLAGGPEANFAQMANGLPGLEVRMPLMFDAIVSKERLSPTEFVRLNCTEPASLYGLEGKGDIAEGFDADIAIWDPTRRVTFGPDDLNDSVGYNPWAGRSIVGWPEAVFSKGQKIVEKDKLLSLPGTGEWLRRNKIGVTPDINPAREYLEATRSVVTTGATTEPKG